MKLVVATGNKGKLAEIRDVLADTGIELVAQGDLGIADADETGTTFIENALLKAKQAARIAGGPALAEAAKAAGPEGSDKDGGEPPRGSEALPLRRCMVVPSMMPTPGGRRCDF